MPDTISELEGKIAAAHHLGETFVETDPETMDYVLRDSSWKVEKGGPGYFYYKSVRLYPKGDREKIESKEKVNFGVQMHSDPSKVLGR